MKKLFISCPMTGRTEEIIKKSMEQLHRIAEAITGEELEVIDTYLEGAEYNDKPLACLGESIKRMQDADYFISPSEIWEWRGCDVERDVARRYRIKVLTLNVEDLMPDAIDAIHKKPIEGETTAAR